MCQGMWTTRKLLPDVGQRLLESPDTVDEAGKKLALEHHIDRWNTFPTFSNTVRLGSQRFQLLSNLFPWLGQIRPMSDIFLVIVSQRVPDMS